MKEKIEPTDKELLTRVHKNDNEAFNGFTSRYKPMIRSIFKSRFSEMQGKLSYDLSQLHEDVESTVWGKLFTKPIETLEFDNKDSIGGLVRTIAERHILSMYEKTENHRSKYSKDQRKKLREEEKIINMDHGFSSLEDNDLNDNGQIDPARINMNEEIIEINLKDLNPLQEKILYLTNSKLTKKEIAQATGLSIDQVRTQQNKINEISANTHEQLHV